MYQNFPKDYLIPVINDYINKDNKGFRFIDEPEKYEDKYIYCEENENIEDAIRRELKEESGLNLVSISEISPFTYSSSGMTDEAVAIAFVNVDGEVSDKFLESSENIIPMLVSSDEINKLMKLPDLKWGSKTWLICKYIKEN